MKACAPVATIPVALLPIEVREKLAMVDTLEARVRELEARPTIDRPRLTWASRKKYAEHRGVSIRTVGVWLAEGMPHDTDPLRINVEIGDAWLAERKRDRR